MYSNRYWFDASHYVKGGPVIVLQSGGTVLIEYDSTKGFLYGRRSELQQRRSSGMYQ